MDCKRRRRFTNELKQEIIQKVKDGISRSDIQKEYGIASSTLSRWICPPDEIIAKANEESVRHHPIQPSTQEEEGYGYGYGDNEIDQILDSYKKRKREDNDDNDDDKLNKKRRLNDDDEDSDNDNDVETGDNEKEEAEDWNRLVNNYKVLR